MKRILMMMLALALLDITGYAQNDKMVKFKTGVNMPIGAYGDTDINDESGYAKTGWNIGVEGAYFFNDWLGVGGSISYSKNNFKDNAFAQNILLDNDYKSVYVRADHYSNVSYLVGPYFKYDFTDKFLITGKALVGLLSVERPDMTIRANMADGNEQELLILKNDWDESFAFGGGLGLIYLIFNNLGLSLDVEYLTGSPDFEYWVGRRPFIIAEDERRVSYMNFNVGVSYYFW